MIRYITASHPDYEKISELGNMIAMAKNPHMFFRPTDEFGRLVPLDIDEPMLACLIVDLENAMEELLEGGVFADWLNGQ